MKQQILLQCQSKSECSKACVRCAGFVVLDYFYSVNEWIKGLRCINCGWAKLEGR